MPTIHSVPDIEGVTVVELHSFDDQRGRFVETYRRSWFSEGREMVQANRSEKSAGSVVGLHYHFHQADYWNVTKGQVRVVLHDLREGSPTDGATFCFDMGENEDSGVFIPPGVAHGFAALSDCTMTYLVDAYYNPDDELGVAWNDPEIGGDWKVESPVLSKRDESNPTRAGIPDRLRPRFRLRTAG